jgi:hypothetical protein
MNPFEIEQEPMHFNKKAVIGILACFFVFILILFGATFGNNADEPEETSTTAETTTEESTTGEVTTQPDDTTNSEITDFITDIPVPPIPGYNAPPETELETTIPETEAPEEIIPEVPVKPMGSYVTLDDTEKLIFATLLRLECGGSSYETKLAVASVVVNRMKMWNSSLRDIVFAKNQFSPAYLINKNTGESYYNPAKDGIYAECWQAVEEICSIGPSIPTYVLYFRSGHYHNWDTLVNYAKIGSLYFSYAPKYTKVCSNCGERFTTTEFKEHKAECIN